MSDLMEKVARGIDPVIWTMIDYTEADTKASKVHADGVAHERDKSLTRARAAIKTVAEWLKDDLGTEFCATGEMLHIKLLAQLEAKP